MATVSSVLQFAGTMLLVLLVFNLMILVHEWGHFLAARWRGLKIEKFQIWMGNPIWKKTYNGVQYGLGWLPLGGFVALPQMAPMDAIEGKVDGAEKLAPIKPIDKIIVAFAGPLFSALLALFFATLVSIYGRPLHPAERNPTIGYILPGGPAAKSELKMGDRILQIEGREVLGFLGAYRSVQWGIASSEKNPIEFLVQRPGEAQPRTIAVNAPQGEGEADKEYARNSLWSRLWSRPPFRRVGIGPAVEYMVESTKPHSPAELAGLKKGDVIVSADGLPVMNATSLFDMAAEGGGKPIKLGIKRDGAMLDVVMTPVKPVKTSELKEMAEFFEKPNAGMVLSAADPDAVILDKPNPFNLIYTMGATSIENLKALIFRKSSVKIDHMSGPVGILSTYYSILKQDHAWQMVLFFSVMLNIGLAIFNLLPLPVLDGGHITMSLIEIIRGKAANIKIMEYLQLGCVLMLLSFVLYVSMKDFGGLLNKEPEIELKFAPPGHQG